MRHSAFALTAFVAMAGSPLTAEDSIDTRVSPKAMVEPAVIGKPTTLRVDIRTSEKELWAGSLTMGPQYGNAYFNHSKSEYVMSCAGERRAPNQATNVNSSLNFNISRSNWQQEPDKFNVNFTWTRPISRCEGHGTDNFGFNRIVEIPPKGSITIEAAGGVEVRISREKN